MLRPILLIVPVAAAVVAGYALVGPGARRPTDAARAYGVVSSSGNLTSLRVTRITSEKFRETPGGGSVEVDIGGATYTAKLDARGAADLVLPSPARAGDALSVRAGQVVLARGNIGAEHPADEPWVLDLAERKATDKGVVIAARVLRGPLVAPFASQVILEARDASGARVAAKLKVSFEGADCLACAAPIANDAAPITITSTFGKPVVTIDADLDTGARAHAYFDLPTHLGGLALVRADGGWAASTPSPTPNAFASFYRAGERIGGASLSPREDATSFYAAPLGALGDGADAVVFSVDPSEETGGTAWSLAHDDAPRFDELPKLALLVDGVPVEQARETKRIHGVYRILFLAIGALAALEITLFMIVAKRTRRAIREHFNDEGEPAPLEPARDTMLLVTVIGITVVLTAGALVGLSFVRG